jgi:DNA-binding MarR family transcriptional regulator
MKFLKVPYSLLSRNDLSLSEKIILSYLISLQGKNDSCWPSLRRISHDIGVSKDTANSVNRSLCEKGLITIDNDGHGKRRHYKIVQEADKDNCHKVRTKLSENKDSELSESYDSTVIKLGQHCPKVRTPILYNIIDPIIDPLLDSASSKQKKKHTTQRKPDPIWDAVVEIWQFQVNQATKARIGKLTRSFKQYGATADDIRKRLELYRTEWPKAADTPEALLKHWDRFGGQAVPRTVPGRVAAPSGKYEGLPAFVADCPPGKDLRTGAESGQDDDPPFGGEGDQPGGHG